MHEHWLHISWVGVKLFSLSRYPEVKLLDQAVLILWGTSILFSIAAPVHSHQQCNSFLSHILLTLLYISYPFSDSHSAICDMVSNKALICISPWWLVMLNIFFMCLLAISMSLKNVYSDPLPNDQLFVGFFFFKVLWLFVYSGY